MPRTALLRATPLLLALSLASPGLAAPAGTDRGLSLKRVLLSTGGVGYFEYEATVSGTDPLTLEVRRDQVDDVLKSITVTASDGSIGTIGLPGAEPLETAFRELPVSPDDLSSPTALLNALKGAEVKVGGARELTGRLLSVTEEATQLGNGAGTTIRHRVSLVTADGLRQLVLEDADAVQFTDPKLQGELERGLAALADGSRKERRRLTIRTEGAGQRTVRVGYVAATPLWKTSYRLTLPEAGAGSGAGTGALQGWAVLENLSGEDWQEVDLAVVSGNPVTLRQALYSPYFVNRPEVPVEVLGRVLPSADEGTVGFAAKAARPQAGMAETAPPPPAMAAPAPMPAPAMAAPAGRAMAVGSAAPMATQMAAESTAATAQVLFRYPQKVTVPNGGTLMMPIAVRSLPAQRIALYQPNVQARHPLAALRLENDTGTALPPGVLTLYETVGGATSFVGDARMATLPAGETRLLSFAVDEAVKIDRSERPEQALTKATLADGLLQLTVTERQTTTYTIAGAAGEPRQMVLELPRRPGWDLVEPAVGKQDGSGGKLGGLTADAYRVPVAVPAGGTVAVKTVLERPRVDRVVLTDLTADRIAAYASADQLPPAARQALQEVATLRAAVAEKERRVADLDRDRAEQVKEQERLRANLSALPAGSDLQKRTLARMGEAETRLDGFARDLTAARAEVETARRTLRDRVKALSF